MDGTTTAHTDDIHLLKQKLLALGLEEEDLDNVIIDVSNLILERVIQDYVAKSDSDSLKLRDKFTNASEDQLVEFFKEHPAELAKISINDFQRVSEKTWKDYFELMSSDLAYA